MSVTKRLIARLDIKGPNLVKGIQLEGLRKLGNPHDFALRYYEQGIDELLYVDIVASLYERNSIVDLIREHTRDIYVPITVGGGIRSFSDARSVLLAGGDKIAINTAALKHSAIFREISEQFGSQSVVAYIEAKNVAQNKWEAYYDNGREKSGRDVIEWAQEAVFMGAGEILLTSVDKEGTAKGIDTALLTALAEKLTVPIIVSGGVGKIQDIEHAFNSGADAVACAHILHYNLYTIYDIKKHLFSCGIHVRHV